jgi:uncharacterized membrane protein YciS (DUF1049 family)
MSYIDKDRLYQTLDNLDARLQKIDAVTMEIHKRMGTRPVALLSIVFVVIFAMSGLHYGLYEQSCQKANRLEQRVRKLETQRASGKTTDDTMICNQKTADAD